MQAEEAKASEKARFVGAIAADIQRDLDEALPLLDAAHVSLKSLHKNNVTEVRDSGNDGVRSPSNRTKLFIFLNRFFSIGERHAATSAGGAACY